MKILKNVKQLESSWLDTKIDIEELKNAISPIRIQEEQKQIQFGENFTRTLVITNFPSEVKPNWLHELYTFRGNLSISTHLVPRTSDKIVDNISKSIEEYDAKLKMNSTPKRKAELKELKKSAESMLEKLISSDNSGIYDVHMYFHLQAESEEELDRETKKLRRLLFKAKLTPYVPKNDMMPAFRSVLPMVQNELSEYTYRNVDCGALSSFFPFDEAVITSDTGIVKGVDAQGNIVLVDIWKFRSYNELIIGATGTGKSFAVCTYILRDFMQGVKIYCIDPDGEIGPTMESIGAQNIIISTQSDNIINPLEILYTIVDDESANISLLHEKISRLKTFFKLIKTDLTPHEASLIEKSLIITYEKKNIVWGTDFSTLKPEDFPIFTDLYETMEEMGNPKLSEFMDIFSMYVTGSNAKMFNGHTKNVDLKTNAPINFNLKHLDPKGDVRGPAMFNILTYLWDEITKDKKTRKRLYVDEAHALKDGENFLFDAYKRARKYKAGVTAASQNVSDFINGGNQKDFNEAIIGNTFSKLLFPVQEIELPQINKNITKLSEEEENILKKETKGEGILIVGNKRVHLNIEASPAELKIIDPEQYEEKLKRGELEWASI